MLAERSIKALQGVHPDLVAIVHRADELGARFHVTEGMRTLERQRSLLKAGKSKTLKSRHLTGHAVDFVAVTLDGGVTYAAEPMRAVADAFKAAARELGYPVEWGGDWRTFKDTPHVELSRKSYPADKPNSVTEQPNSAAPQPVASAAPLPVPPQASPKPLARSRTLWNMGLGASFLTWLGGLFTQAMQIITEAGTQFAALGASREMLAIIGGNSSVIAWALGIGCLVSAACVNIGDKTPPPEGTA